jgi:hypothetical protein
LDSGLFLSSKSSAAGVVVDDFLESVEGEDDAANDDEADGAVCKDTQL